MINENEIREMVKEIANTMRIRLAKLVIIAAKINDFGGMICEICEMTSQISKIRKILHKIYGIGNEISEIIIMRAVKY